MVPPDFQWTEVSKRSKWFFLNGIATAPPMAMLETRELARVFARPIHLIHTPTYGVVWDMWDAINARTLRKDGELATPAFHIVCNALRSHDHIVLLCYSQGTIIASYIVRSILKDPELRKHAHKLEIYCIAGVADSLHIDYVLTAEYGHPVPYVEHFANGQDFFARIGVLSHYYATYGAVFVRPDKRGHMLTDHYIPGIARGDYCQGRSRLSKYVGGRFPTANDYIAFDRRR
jgi:predicted esterase